MFFFFFSSRRRHTRFSRDWSSDVCSSDLGRRCSAGAPTCSDKAGGCCASRARATRSSRSSAAPKPSALPRPRRNEERDMARRLLVIAAALTAACASARGGTAPSPAPGATPAPASAVAEAPAAAGAATPAALRADVIRYGPSGLRYVIHRRLHIQQALGGQEQGQDLGARIYVSAAIAGPADSVGYPATFTVDSVVPDSG